jgi:hypothetical protein
MGRPGWSCRSGPWHHRYREIVGDANSKRKDAALDRLQAMDVVTDVGEQGRIAQLLQPEIINKYGKGELALIEGASTDRENAASASDARVMRRSRRWPSMRPEPQ